MCEDCKVTHVSPGTRYRIVIERAASTKGVLGFKVESNGDDINQVIQDVGMLKERVEVLTEAPEVKET
mgnify:CR=1 FL=1